MAGPLVHSPAAILRALLVQKGVGSDPPSTNWPLFSDSIPDYPDNAVYLENQDGTDSGREQIIGDRLEHHGVVCTVRALNPLVGYTKTRQIVVAMDRSIDDDEVTIDAVTYRVAAVSRRGDIIALGKESPTSKRTLHTFESVVSLRQLS